MVRAMGNKQRTPLLIKFRLQMLSWSMKVVVNGRVWVIQYITVVGTFIAHSFYLQRHSAIS